MILFLKKEDLLSKTFTTMLEKDGNTYKIDNEANI